MLARLGQEPERRRRRSAWGQRRFERRRQQRVVEVGRRVVAARHRDLERRSSAARFRKGTILRLRVVEILCPRCASARRTSRRSSTAPLPARDAPRTRQEEESRPAALARHWRAKSGGQRPRLRKRLERARGPPSGDATSSGRSRDSTRARRSRPTRSLAREGKKRVAADTRPAPPPPRGARARRETSRTPRFDRDGAAGLQQRLKELGGAFFARASGLSDAWVEDHVHGKRRGDVEADAGARRKNAVPSSAMWPMRRVPAFGRRQTSGVPRSVGRRSRTRRREVRFMPDNVSVKDRRRAQIVRARR